MSSTRTLLIRNELGLHARAATQLAKLANEFDAHITVMQGDKCASANSVLGLMMLESHMGKEIQLIGDGPDADKALDAIEALVACRFNESE